MGNVPKKELSLFDSTCLIVGIIIGAGIYETAPAVAGCSTSWLAVMALWAAGGLLSLFGALGYAELAAAYPREGGDYVYLSRAYGPWAGFLFGWVQLVIVRPGDIAAMAFIFSRYGRSLFDPLSSGEAAGGHGSNLVYAAGAVAVLTLINVIGVREGKWTQNLLTSVKALGLLAILAVALAGPRGTGTGPAAVDPGSTPLSLALILVLFTFGGWNEMAYVAAEVKRPERNIVRALVIGTIAVTVLYLLANGAFFLALGHGGTAASDAVAADTIGAAFPEIGGRLISALICISALGAVNGLIFTGARISYAVGADHHAFRLLGRWHPRTGTPVAALLVQAAVAVVLIIVLGSFLDTVLYTAAAVYSFYLATSAAVFVLRRKEPLVARPYRVTGFPVTTVIFCAVCAFLICSAVKYAVDNNLWFAAITGAMLLAGIPIYWLSSRRASRQ